MSCVPVAEVFLLCRLIDSTIESKHSRGPRVLAGISPNIKRNLRPCSSAVYCFPCAIEVPGKKTVAFFRSPRS